MRNNEAQVKLLVQAVTKRRHCCRRSLVDIREERLEHRTGCNRRRTTGGALHRQLGNDRRLRRSCPNITRACIVDFVLGAAQLDDGALATHRVFGEEPRTELDLCSVTIGHQLETLGVSEWFVEQNKYNAVEQEHWVGFHVIVSLSLNSYL